MDCAQTHDMSSRPGVQRGLEVPGPVELDPDDRPQVEAYGRQLVDK